MITLKHESSRHCVIYEEADVYRLWLATLNTEHDKGIGEAVKELIEARLGNCAKGNDQ